MTEKVQGKTRKHSLISEHYDGIVEKMKMRRKDVPDYYYQLNEEQKLMNEYIMQSMNKKINYLRNPRYRTNNSPIFYADDITGKLEDNLNPFRATPEEIVFKDYDMGEIYSASLSLVNADKVLRRIKYVPPKR